MNNRLKNGRLRVGLALYDYDWIFGTGTERIAQELAHSLVGLSQSVIEYKVLLRHDVDARRVGLPEDACVHAPESGCSFSNRLSRKSGYFFYKGIDRVRTHFKAAPLLGYLGRPRIKKWLRELDLDLLYLPSMWYDELIVDIPIVAQLYDMQHMHFPEFFQGGDHYFQRKIIFGWFARHAAKITCNFDFVVSDIESSLKIHKERVAPVFLAPPRISLENISDTLEVINKYDLPRRYLIYPAATWPHKNHLNLIRAISKCIRLGLDIHCVCPGENRNWLYPGQFARIKEEIGRYGLEKNISFPGCLELAQVYALIRGADFVCVPSFYEAGCYPIWEAFILGKTVAASEVTMIPYQVRDAGLLFDPFDPDDIACAIRLLWENAQLRDQLGQKARDLIKSEYCSEQKTAWGYHRIFVNTLIDSGRLSAQYRINEDPAAPLDRGPAPAKFAWRQL